MWRQNWSTQNTFGWLPWCDRKSCGWWLTSECLQCSSRAWFSWWIEFPGLEPSELCHSSKWSMSWAKPEIELTFCLQSSCALNFIFEKIWQESIFVYFFYGHSALREFSRVVTIQFQKFFLDFDFRNYFIDEMFCFYQAFYYYYLFSWFSAWFSARFSRRRNHRE